jgi:hypothetical protein
VLLALLAQLACGLPLRAASVTVAWDAPSENSDGTPLTDLAGYSIYYGASPDSCTNVQDAGLSTTTSVSNLPEGATHYFTVTARNTAGRESAPCPVVACSIPQTVDRFAWSVIPSPQVCGDSFPVAITALDKTGATVSNFSGEVRLSAPVPLIPSAATGFTAGVWTGSVTLLAGGGNLVVTAEDAEGHRGSSAPLDVHLRLSVWSERGGASPGTLTAAYGAALTQSVTNSPIVEDQTQLVCTGAVVTGNVFTRLSSTRISLTLTNNATLAWQWRTNYWIALATSGGGALSATSNWRRAGTKLTVNASPAAYYHLAGWDGDTAECIVSSNALVVPVSRPRSLQALFAPDQTEQGTPLWWLAAHGLAPNADAAGEDQDGDGMSNWQEYVAGTDPTNEASYLRLSLPAGSPGGSVEMSFQSVPGRRYELWRAARLDGEWLAAPEAPPVQGDGGRMIVRDPGDASARFYRLRVRLP